MTDRERIAERAQHLLPEEERVGSDDPEAQADAVLAESDERERYVANGAGRGRDASSEPACSLSTPDLRIEHRTADEAASE
jgi:hypothetical protein